jgi:uncharacterized Zn finger protein
MTDLIKCPSCGDNNWKEFDTDPPLLNYKVWVRCLRCGNIAARDCMILTMTRVVTHGGIEGDYIPHD